MLEDVTLGLLDSLWVLASFVIRLVKNVPDSRVLKIAEQPNSGTLILSSLERRHQMVNPGLQQCNNGRAVAKTEPCARTFVEGIENCGSISLLRIRMYTTSKQSTIYSLAIKEP